MLANSFKIRLISSVSLVGFRIDGSGASQPNFLSVNILTSSYGCINVTPLPHVNEQGSVDFESYQRYENQTRINLMQLNSRINTATRSVSDMIA
ncbi:LOW QUALITY PROTEIN: hypothetical protein HID58_006097 [Brassica napus]|uniref:Uncharacterized protein n=1 Tax=Brassica napus TaxID=3708 RepID=A0ABQ8EAH6_BRANA|nr:LOW QUALITY PROTEIN: hypothetical protein HID58_006097 [Brassica napus]